MQNQESLVPCCHRGDPVAVGKHRVYAAGLFHQPSLSGYDIIVPLSIDQAMPLEFGVRYDVFAAPLPDFGGVDRHWPEFVRALAEKIVGGKRVCMFCLGGHGRTGTLLASLVAVMESREETPDPIAAVRGRYCPHAVETKAQAKAVFALRMQKFPEQYKQLR